MELTLKDFKPVNHWIPDSKGPNWRYASGSKYIIDGSTGKKYFNEESSTIRTKCFLLILGTPLIHSIASICNIAYRTFKVLTLAELWLRHDEEKPSPLKGRLTLVAADLAKAVAAPLVLAGLCLSAIYGLFMPYDARKLYGALERAEYGGPILAPCFQPNPDSHFFGGDANIKGAY
jgi:hypothetical protein